jgi:SAM-dependent methyltransferase
MRWSTLSDMSGARYNQIFQDLEHFENLFFSAHKKIDGNNYAWPMRPLYEWSRRVEYPFVVDALSPGNNMRVLDAGSGVTFLPFYLKQKLELEVECLDNEPSYAQRMKQICDLLSCPSFRFHNADLTDKLPFKDGDFNSVLCISVLEHLAVENRTKAIHELWRLVARGGQLIMTFDVSLVGERKRGFVLSELEEIKLKMEEITGCALPRLPDRLPDDLLTPQNPGYGLAPLCVHEKIIRSGVKSLFYRTIRHRLPFQRIACLICSIPKFPS